MSDPVDDKGQLCDACPERSKDCEAIIDWLLCPRCRKKVREFIRLMVQTEGERNV